MDNTIGQTTGSLLFPKKHMKFIKTIHAYSDEQGVYNLFMKDEGGQIVSSYDPNEYGDSRTVKIDLELMSHLEIIGVYGTKPSGSGTIFSNLGFLALSRVPLPGRETTQK